MRIEIEPSGYRAEMSDGYQDFSLEIVGEGREQVLHFRRIFKGKVLDEILSDNPLVFGEQMRDSASFSVAHDLLTQAGVPADNLVWRLGAKG